MRIKNFTLMTLALLMMSVVAFAQKPGFGMQFKNTPIDKAQIEALDAQRSVMKQYLPTKTTVAPRISKVQQQSVSAKIKASGKTRVKTKGSRRTDPSGVTYTFDASTMEGWTTIDADGDGYNWMLATEVAGVYLVETADLSGTGHNESQDFVMSASYCNMTNAALNPDNYLVSPKVALGGAIEFYACGQDASYVAEHFGVAVSTTGNTDASDFTTIKEWTMSAAPVLAPSFANGNPNGFKASRRAQGNWYRFVVKLDGYSGQQGYVAIRHFGCSDEFMLDVDDITIYPEGVEVEEPEVFTKKDFYLDEGAFWLNGQYGFENYSDDQYHVVLGIGDKGNVTLTGLAYYFDGVVTGTISGNKITIPSGQLVGEDEYGPEYIVGADDSFFAVDNIEFEYDEEAGTLTALTPYIVESASEAQVQAYALWENPVFSTSYLIKNYNPAPSGLVTEEWGFFATDLASDEDVLIPVEVGFDGNDVYIIGLYNQDMVSCIKGTRDGNTVTFPTGQFLSYYDTWFFGIYYYYLLGYGENGVQDITMTLNTEENLMTTSDYLIISEKQWRLDLDYVSNVLSDAYLKKDYKHTITFTAADDVNIQNGKAKVAVDGTKVDVDADGKVIAPETKTVTMTAAKGYKFTSVTSTGATIELDRDGFVATFVMPEEDITVNYEMRELYNEVQFSTSGEYTIQDGQATVTVNGDDVTDFVDGSGKLIDVPTDANVVITAEPGFKLANVTASYKEKAAGGEAEVEIGSAEGLNSYLPSYSLYNNSLTEQIYTASEVGQAGSIKSIAFYNGDQEKTRNIDIYLVHTSKSVFESATDWIDPSASDKVFSGEVTFTPGEWTTITFDNSFDYNGTDNLAVIVDDNTGNWSSGLKCEVFNATGYQAIRVYNDYTNYDPTVASSTYTGTLMDVKNYIKLGFTGGGASGELTVYDGTTTNGYVPVYGFYADAYNKCEFVMPASVLTGMSGSSISAMKFYASQTSVNWGSAEFKVFMKEVTDETISAFSGVEGATVVYEGALSIADGEMNVEFTTPYTYNGGNLLIGFYQPVTGSYVSAQFYGETVTGASISGYSYSSLDDISPSPTQRNFLPKTTFTCAGGGSSSVIDLEVNLDADGYSASFTAPDANVTVNYELVRLGYTINVPANAYITYITDKDIIIYDDDVELLTVTAVSATEATVTPLTVVAANTPMLIHNNSNAEKTLWIVPTEETHDKPAATEVTVAPEFKGTLVEKAFTDAEMAAKDFYVCTGQNFTWVRNAGTIGANKCWLEVDKNITNGSQRIIIGTGNGNSGDATGIDTIVTGADKGQWYDLNGRKLNAVPTQKGVYVINGKKVVIK